MKLTADRLFANPEAAARKMVEIAAGIEPVQDGRIHIEKINAPFLYAGGVSIKNPVYPWFAISCSRLKDAARRRSGRAATCLNDLRPRPSRQAPMQQMC
ncbi:hypothetical protein Q2941_43525 [Bradyrhizobium sp. UFLA05-153]